MLHFRLIDEAPPESASRQVVSREPDDAPLAYGWIDSGGACWLEFPAVATFRFSQDTPEIEALPRRPIDEAVLRDTFMSDAVPIILQARGFEALHASASRFPSGVVAICARSGRGKSTLAYALSRHGHPHWADDTVVLDVSSAFPPSCVPMAFTIQLREQSRTAFGLRSANAPKPGESFAQPCPLAGTLLPAWAPADSEPAIERLEGSEAVIALLEHAHCFVVSEEARRRALESYMKIVRDVPVARLSIPDDLDRLPEVIAAVERFAEDC